MDTPEPPDPLLEDREIKFDQSNVWKHLHNGEMTIYSLTEIEDSKGYVGEGGRLLSTNLRVIWHLEHRKKSNLSIGYNCISTMNSRIMPGKSQGTSTNALYIMAISNGTRFEFLFTDISECLERKRQAIFQTFLDIYRVYQRTYLYRDLRLRGAILLANQLVLLPREQMVNRVHGVWNLSSDQGNLGCFVVTNVRIVWYADSNGIFNISLPYIQIENIYLRDSKYGPALVIKTAETGGSYVLGFRIDPMERLKTTYQEFLVLHRVYNKNPDLGVDTNAFLSGHSSVVAERENARHSAAPSEEVEEESEIDERQELEVNSKLNSYLATAFLASTSRAGGGEEGTTTTSPRRHPVYCQELGFAMEKIRDGYSVRDLWDVLPPNRILIESTEDEAENDGGKEGQQQEEVLSS